jgi:hypothetical protein
MDHDRNFKQLLSNFFVEFVDLFLPNVSEYLDRSFDIVPMDKEVFTDVTLGDSHEVDLVMRVKFRGEEAFFLVHVENQATAQSDFPKRMFRYFARLTEKYDLPVYPVVLFSYDEPLRPEPNHFDVTFPGETVLQFRYKVIQLNRLSWRKFVKQENPVASALMAKMKMTVKERPRVRAECFRLLSRLKLDPARTKLIGGFIESYLRLTAEEMKQYERIVAKFLPEEREATMGLVSSWEQKGIDKGREEGLHEGKENLVLRLIRRRFGSVADTLAPRLDELTSEQLDELGEALLDFTASADLEQWLTRQQNAAH